MCEITLFHVTFQPKNATFYLLGLRKRRNGWSPALIEQEDLPGSKYTKEVAAAACSGFP